MLVYLVRVKPFETSLNNQLEIFNEFIVLLVSGYHCIAYSDFGQLTLMPDVYQVQAGWSFIAIIVCVQIPVNLIAIGASNMRDMWVRRALT